MPTPLLRSYHEQFGIPLAELEKMWAAAKAIAARSMAKTSKGYYGLVVTILKNMLGLKTKKKISKSSTQRIQISLSRLTPKAKSSRSGKLKLSKATLKKSPTSTKTGQPKKSKRADLPEWWMKKTPQGQRNYLKAHPNSSLAPTLRENLKPLSPGGEKKNGKSPAKPEVNQLKTQKILDTRTEKEVREDKAEADRIKEVAAANADLPPKNPTSKQRSIFRNLFSAGSKALKSVYHAVRDFTQGAIEGANEALREYANPENPEENPDDLQEKHNKAVKIMGVIATAAIVAGIGAGIFMLAPGLGPSIAEAYLTRRYGGSEIESESSTKNDGEPSTVEEFAKDFADWLSHQDIEKLVKDIEGTDE